MKYWRHLIKRELQYRCPCCSYFTFRERPTETYDICPVSFWEDDPIQFNDPEYAGGANDPSLNQARQNFLDFGVCQRDMIPHARKPKKGELTSID